MYLIFLTMTGVGLMVIYNINAIASSVGKSPSTFFVTLVSLANGLGRVLAGFISDISVKYISKLELLSIVILFMSITQALHSIGSGFLLYPCLLAVGFLFGCTVSLMAINIADIFGGQFIATNFGAIDSAAILGTVIFAAGVVNLFYKESDGDDDYGTNSCYETNCFRIPFVINSSFCLLAFAVCLFVNWRTPSSTGGAH
jgi:MFS family permease